ncbi:oxidoreductase [Sphingobium sp. TB-6]|nr:oxidoreductase [Sphingobium sp. TB-6]
MGSERGRTLQDVIETEVLSTRIIAHDVKLIELGRIGGGPFPGFAAGAHVDVHLPGGLIRQYSLLNAPSSLDRYVIAVAREANSRGGSAFLHDALVDGDRLTIGLPRCHFPLAGDSSHSILIAGGIGITPIWCMAQQLMESGRSFQLHYAARTRGHAALLDRIAAGAPTALNTYFNLEGDPLMDLPAIIAAAPEGSHFYCCGPMPLIEAYRAACARLPAERVHLEQFAATQAAATDGGYTVELAKTGISIEVTAGETILDALAREGIAMSYSCREGICGSCETAVIEGTPDHRDAILTQAERAEGRTMMICCSGSLTSRLILDI